MSLAVGGANGNVAGGWMIEWVPHARHTTTAVIVFYGVGLMSALGL